VSFLTVVIINAWYVMYVNYCDMLMFSLQVFALSGSNKQVMPFGNSATGLQLYVSSLLLVTDSI